MWSTFSSSLRKSSTSRTVFGVSVVRNVVFVLTRKPRSFASAIASTALSKMPSRSTNWSCRSRMPSRCTTHAKYGDGSKRSIFFFIRIAFEQRKTNFFRLISSRAMTSHLGMHERLAAGDRDHRRARLLDRVERLLHRHPLLEDLLRVLDLPAERAREIALEERLELDEQRELVVPLDALLREVARDGDALAERDAHARDLARKLELHGLARRHALLDLDAPEAAERLDEPVDELLAARTRRP